jgi:NADP-dependent 3-hydroxy acid dehydrogenase YdfG
MDDWKWMMDVNVWGVIHGAPVFLPCFLERGPGHIVNTASIAGQAGVLNAAVP